MRNIPGVIAGICFTVVVPTLASMIWGQIDPILGYWIGGAAVIIGTISGAWAIWLRRHPQPPSQVHLSPGAKRDTKMKEALAYVETGQWGSRFFAIVSRPSPNPEKGFSPDDVRQAAIDGDIRIWGRPSPNDAHVLINSKYWETWQIDWYTALGEEAQTDKRVTGAPGFKYYDLMVSLAEFEARWPPKPHAAEPDWSFHDVMSYFETQVRVPHNDLDTICDKLRSAARVGQITVWGRPKKKNLSMLQKAKKPLEPIPSDHWRDYQFDEVRCLTHPDPKECRTEPDDGGHSELHYFDLKFFKAEIVRKWKGPE